MTGLLQRDVLVISQKAKLIEMTNEYRILDPEGEEVGTVREEGQSKAKKLLRLVSDVDQFLTHRLSVYEADGTKLLEIVRPAKIFQVHLADPRRRRSAPRSDRSRERHRQEAVRAPRTRGRTARVNRRGELALAWDFAIHEADGTEIARVTKRWAGFLREGFTTADHYVPEITGPTSPDLRFLLVASAAALDTALKQDDSGGWGFGGLDLTDLIP